MVEEMQMFIMEGFKFLYASDKAKRIIIIKIFQGFIFQKKTQINSLLQINSFTLWVSPRSNWKIFRGVCRSGCVISIPQPLITLESDVQGSGC